MFPSSSKTNTPRTVALELAQSGQHKTSKWSFSSSQRETTSRTILSLLGLGNNKGKKQTIPTVSSTSAAVGVAVPDQPPLRWLNLPAAHLCSDGPYPALLAQRSRPTLSPQSSFSTLNSNWSLETVADAPEARATDKVKARAEVQTRVRGYAIGEVVPFEVTGRRGEFEIGEVVLRRVTQSRYEGRPWEQKRGMKSAKMEQNRGGVPGGVQLGGRKAEKWGAVGARRQGVLVQVWVTVEASSCVLEFA